MKPLRYLDFELKIEREEDHYTARVLRSPAGEAKCDFTLPFSEDKLELLVLKLGRPRSSTSRIHYSAEMEAARELGGKLFEVVFGGDVRACLRSSLDETSRKERTGLRLKLRLQEAPLLADLPWEFLLDASLDRFFAQSNQTPIVRYIEMPERIKPITINLPLHFLVMISSPADYLRLDVERERSGLLEALDSLSKAGKVSVKWLEEPTLANLQRCLREGEYHVFHFIGHGGFVKKAEEGVLVLEDEQGRGVLADAHRIGTLLHDHQSLKLVVLNSCEGARNSLTDPFAGVATGLIRQGVPAVVAMQFEITDEAAITFASEFYAALADGLPVDAAVAEARKTIYSLPNDIEWGTPVLYMRSSDGVLFNLNQKTAVGETPPPAPKSVAAPPETEIAPKAQGPMSTIRLPAIKKVIGTRILESKIDIATALTILSIFILLGFMFFITKVSVIPLDFYTIITIFPLSILIGYQFAAIRYLFSNTKPTFEKLKPLFKDDSFQTYSDNLDKKLQKYVMCYIVILLVVIPFMLLEFSRFWRWKISVGPTPTYFYLFEPSNQWALALDIYNHIIGYLALFLLAIIVWRVINLIEIVNALDSNTSIKVDIFHIDDMGGLRPLRNFILIVVSNYFIIITLAIISYIIPAAIISYEAIFLIILLLLGVILFVITLKTVRNLINKGLKFELDKINEEYKKNHTKLINIVSDKKHEFNENEVKKLSYILDVLEKEKIRIKEISQRGYDLTTIVIFVGSFLIPTITLIEKVIRFII